MAPLTFLRRRADRWLADPRLRAGGRAAGLKAVSGFLSGAAWLTRRPAGPYRRDQVRRILAVRLDPLGDLLLTRPALGALRHGFPAARIDLLVLPVNASIARLYPEIDDVYAYNVHQLRPSGDLFNAGNYRDLAALIRRLRANRYDLAIAYCGRVSSFFAWAAGARWRIGFAGEAAAGLLTDPVPGHRYHLRRHEARYCLDLSARAVGDHERPAFVPLPLDPAATARLAAKLPAWTSTDRPKVVIHPGASNGWAKRWTPEGFAAVARDLHERHGARVAITGSAGEADLTGTIAAAAGPGTFDLAGMLSLTELAALLAGADVVVSGDSGPLHIATQLGRPVVGIYGPSDPRLSGPFEGTQVVVRNPLPCSPCYDASAPAICPLVHHRCLRELPPEQVVTAVEQHLAAVRPATAVGG